MGELVTAAMIMTELVTVPVPVPIPLPVPVPLIEKVKIIYENDF